MVLEVTWNRLVRVWWSFFWRNILLVILSFMIGALLGGISGYVLERSGLRQYIPFFTVPAGLIIGIGLSFIPLEMIIGKDFGDFKLVLLEKENNAEE